MRDYLVIEARSQADDVERLAWRDRLEASGAWRAVAERRRLSILLEAAAPPAYGHLPGVAGGLIGDVFDGLAARQGQGAAFAVQRLAQRPPREAARLLARQAFGRYLAIFTEPERTLMFRDPIGALEAVTWRKGGLTLIASRLPQDPQLWPDDLAIDWAVVGQVLRQRNLASHLSPLAGVASIEPGVLVDLAAPRAGERLWSPRVFAAHRDRRARPGDLAKVVDGVVAAYALGRGPILCEISGGLDSAIVATSLAAAGTPLAGAINHSFAEIEADERAFAQAIADQAGLGLEVVARGPLVLDADKLARAAGGPRPNFVGGDPDHDADLAARLAARSGEDGVAALFTGRGGDGVFFQMAAAELARDLLFSRRPGAPRLKGLAILARRRGTTVWRLIGEAWAQRRQGLAPMPAGGILAPALAASPPGRHPWLEDLAGVSPAKRVQLRGLVNSFSSFRESQRHRAGDVLDPLLSQPVIEHCLAIPAPLLALGDTDRPFARRAFADRLPAASLARRGKGDLSVFFARSLAASLGFLRPYLLDGRLAAAGLLDRAALEALLDEDSLIWRDATAEVYGALAIEAWVRCWETRLARAGRGRGA